MTDRISKVYMKPSQEIMIVFPLQELRLQLKTWTSVAYVILFCKQISKVDCVLRHIEDRW